MKITKQDMAELQAAAAAYRPRQRFWTENERLVLRTFYGKVPDELLCQKLKRTPDSIQHQALNMGLRK